MAKRRRIQLFDIGSLPITPVKREENYDRTLADYNRREQAREKQEAATREAEIQRVNKDTSRLMAECLSVSATQMTSHWAKPLDFLSTHFLGETSFDNLFLPTKEYDASEKQAVYDTIQKFLDDVIFEQGFSLGDASRRRFGYYVASQVNAGVIVDSASLAVMFKRCFDLGIFKNDDSEFVEHFRVEPPPAKQPRVEPVEQPRQVTYADLDAVNESTREGVREARRIAEELYQQEGYPIVRAWVKSVADTFGYVISTDDLKHVTNWMNSNGRSWVDKKSFDLARRALVMQGIFPTSCLTNVERLNVELEATDTSRMGFEERRALRIREKMAIEADMKQFGRL